MMTKTRRRCWETQNDASQLATRRHPRRRKDPDTGVGSQNVAGPTSALGDPTTVTTSPTRMGTPETTPTNPTPALGDPTTTKAIPTQSGMPKTTRTTGNGSIASAKLLTGEMGNHIWGTHVCRAVCAIFQPCKPLQFLQSRAPPCCRSFSMCLV